MFVADAHSDTLYALAIEGKTLAETMITPEHLAAGGVGLQTFAMFAGPKGPSGGPEALGKKMLASTRLPGVPLMTGALPDTPPETPHGILAIEGGEMLEGSVERLRDYHRAGVKMIALTWNNENELAYPAKNDCGRGLKPTGREIVREMDRLGVLADVSHLNERGFYDLAALSCLPIVASHSNYKPLLDHPRNLTRGQVETIIEKKGYIGINFYPYFLTGTREAALDDVLRHIDAIAELGGIDVLGFGSDFDGIDCQPRGLETPACFPRLLERLLERGYTRPQVEKIAGGNFYRVLKMAEKKEAQIV